MIYNALFDINKSLFNHKYVKRKAYLNSLLKNLKNAKGILDKSYYNDAIIDILNEIHNSKRVNSEEDVNELLETWINADLLDDVVITTFNKIDKVITGFIESHYFLAMKKLIEFEISICKIFSFKQSYYYPGYINNFINKIELFTRDDFLLIFPFNILCDLYFWIIGPSARIFSEQHPSDSPYFTNQIELNFAYELIKYYKSIFNTHISLEFRESILNDFENEIVKNSFNHENKFRAYEYCLYGITKLLIENENERLIDVLYLLVNIRTLHFLEKEKQSIEIAKISYYIYYVNYLEDMFKDSQKSFTIRCITDNKYNTRFSFKDYIKEDINIWKCYSSESRNLFGINMMHNRPRLDMEVYDATLYNYDIDYFVIFTLTSKYNIPINIDWSKLTYNDLLKAIECFENDGCLRESKSVMLTNLIELYDMASTSTENIKALHNSIRDEFKERSISEINNIFKKVEEEGLLDIYIENLNTELSSYLVKKDEIETKNEKISQQINYGVLTGDVYWIDSKELIRRIVYGKKIISFKVDRVPLNIDILGIKKERGLWNVGITNGIEVEMHQEEFVDFINKRYFELEINIEIAK